MNYARPSEYRRNGAFAILGSAALAILAVQTTGIIEGNFKFPWTLGIVVLTVVMLDLLMLFSALRLRVKVLVLFAQLLLLIGGGVFIRTFLKMQGSFTGAGVPRLVWKSTLPPDAALAPSRFLRNPLLSTLSRPAKIGLNFSAQSATTPSTIPVFPVIGQPMFPSNSGGNPSAQDGVRSPSSTDLPSPRNSAARRKLTTCLEARTGAVRWQHANTTRFEEGMGGDGPRATPTILDGRVYVMGATGILDCLDGATGSVIWSRNILEDVHAKNLIWGKSCSPLIVDQFIIVTGGDSPGPSLLAFDKQTGKPIWKSGTDQSAYCSPALATIAGRRELVVVNAHSVTGCDLSDGTQLWSFPWPGNWPKVSQAVPFDGDRIFISAGYGLGCSMLHITTDANGTQSVSPLWNNRKLKTEFTNIAVKDNFIYGLDDSILTCLDSATGTKKCATEATATANSSAPAIS